MGRITGTVRIDTGGYTVSESRLICIVGPDGAGKSTQAEMLMEELAERGHDCEYRWLGFNHYFSLPLLAFARVIGLSEIETLDSGRKIGYHYFERSKIIMHLYPLLLLVDTLLAYLFKVALPRKLSGKTIICDRFIYDTIVNIMLSTDQPSFPSTFIGRLFSWLIPDDTEAYVLTADEETLRRRRDDVEADDSLQAKIQYYSIIADQMNLPVINATKSPESIHEEIQQRI